MKLLSLILFSGMALIGIFQTFIYLRLKRHFHLWEIVPAEVTHSKMLDQLGASGEQLIEAIIYFKYTIEGKEYEANTPVLRGYELFPCGKYERSLVSKYPVGEACYARVFPLGHELAYLEVAPLSTASSIMAPIMAVGGIAVIIAYFYGVFSFLGFA